MPTYSEEVLADSPSRYWPLETLTDISTTAKDLRLEGSTTLDGPGLVADGGTSARLPGASSLTGPATYNSIDNYTSFTVEAWINLDAISGTQVIVGHYYYLYSPNQIFDFQVTSSGKLQLFCVTDDYTYPRLSSVATLAPGTGYHVVGVRDQTNNELRLYINGVLDSTLATTGTLRVNQNLNYRVGGSLYTGTNYLTGYIDNVALYYTPLSDARIAAHYAAGSGAASGGTMINATADPVSITVTPGDVSALTSGPVPVTADALTLTVTPSDAAADVVRYVRITADPVAVLTEAYGHALLNVPVAVSPAGVIDPTTGGYLVEPDLVAMSAVAAAVNSGTPEPISALLAVQPQMPDPATVLGKLGRPRSDAFVPSDVIVTPIGWLRVTVNSKDVTFLRGVPVQVESITEGEPFGWGTATVYFPQVSPFESETAGDASLLQDGFDLDIHLVSPSGEVLETLFEGLIVDRNGAVEENGRLGLTVTATGALFQADFVLASPRLVVNSVELAARVYNRLNIVPGRRYQRRPTDSTTTGIEDHTTGSWEPLLTGYIQDILATATTADGTNQWTLTCEPGRKPVIRLKDRTTVHHSITLGTPGVSVNLNRDSTQATTTLFGKGVDDANRGYANLKLPYRDDVGPEGNIIKGAWFAPFASVSEVEPWLYDADGEHLYNPDGTWQANPDFNPYRLRVERWRAFADGTSKPDAFAIAAAEIARDDDPGWTGTIRMRVDAEATHRWQIHAGHNIQVKGWQGGMLLLHISAVERNAAGEVTLTVDSKARDLLTLDAIADRNRNAVGPARRKGNPHRKTELQDSRPVVDSELAGWITDVACSAGAWKVVRVPLGNKGAVVGVDLTTDAPTRFAFALFNGSPSYTRVADFTARLEALVPTPLELRSDALYANRQPFGGDEAIQNGLADLGWIDTLGGPGQAAGFWPGAEDQGDAITGRHKDEALSLPFNSASELWVYAAIWCQDATVVNGRITVAPQE